MTDLKEIFSEEKLNSLTKNQREVMNFIVEFMTKTGAFPSCADITRYRQDKFRMSAYQYLMALADKGFLKHVGNGPRRHFAIKARVLLLPEE